MDLTKISNKDVIHNGPPASGKTEALVNEAVKYVIGDNNVRVYIVSCANRMSKWILKRVQDKLAYLGVEATIEDSTLSVKGNRTQVEAGTTLTEASLVLIDEYASIEHRELLNTLKVIQHKRQLGENIRVEMYSSPTNWLSDYIIRNELKTAAVKQLI